MSDAQIYEPEEKEFKIGAKVRFSLIGCSYSKGAIKVPTEGFVVDAVVGRGEDMWVVMPRKGIGEYIRSEDDMELI